MSEKGNSQSTFVLLVFIALLVSACSSTAPAETTPMSDATQTILPATRTATQTQAPSAVPPTVPASPLPTITPASRVELEPHALALDSNAVALDMQLLRRIGTGEPNDVLWSPDGKYLAVATSRGIYLYDGRTYEEMRFLDIGKNAVTFTFSPDSRELAVATEGTASVWNVASGQQVSAMQGKLDGNIYKIVYGAGGHIAAFGNNCRSCGDSLQAVFVWDGQSGKELYFEDNIYRGTNAIDISPDGDTLIYYRGDFVFLDLVNRDSVRESEGAPNITRLVAHDLLISPDNESFFISSRSTWAGDISNSLVSFNEETSLRILADEECRGAKKSGVYAVCYGEEEVIVFSLIDGQKLTSIKIEHPVQAVSIDLSGERIAIIQSDSVLIIDGHTENVYKTFEYNIFDNIVSGIISRGGLREYIAATSERNGAVTFWNLVTGEMVESIQVSSERIRSLAFSPDQSTLATVDGLGVIRLIDVNASSITRIYDLDDLVSGPLTYNPNGLELALLYGDPPDIYALNLQNGELGLKRQGNSIYKFFYTNNGSLISWTWGPDHLSLVNLDSNSILRFPYDLLSQDASPEVMALSPDGRFTVFGLDRSAMLVGETDKLEFIHELNGHTIQGGDGGFGSFRDMKFNPVSNLLVSIGSDRTTRLWSVESGIELKTFEICCYAKFTNDGRFLVAAGNSVIQVWGVPPLP